MADFQSDAFVFFGATGDLAHKQLFLSLQGLIRPEKKIAVTRPAYMLLRTREP
jgi:glucose-6-phosphate 1-dehydrogenase